MIGSAMALAFSRAIGQGAIDFGVVGKQAAHFVCHGVRWAMVMSANVGERARLLYFHEFDIVAFRVAPIA